MSITAILSSLGILAIYLYAGYIIVKAASNGLGNNEGFEWSWKVVGEIIGWLPLIIISFILLRLNYNKMQPYKKSKKPEDRDVDDDSSYH